MGRKIRRVPKGWQHPRDERGHKPLYDKDYDSAALEWLSEFREFYSDANAEERKRIEQEHGIKFFWDWHGMPPNEKYYRPAWAAEEMTHYQAYETVSEGTPISPVFETLDELKSFLLAEGHSASATDEFIRGGWAPSMVIIPGRGISPLGIDSLDWLKKE